MVRVKLRKHLTGKQGYMINDKGFTLIELLIVVAIIGILAAIAVPNFLNAQTRARLARIQADFKNIETALEMYQLDYSSFPTDAWRGFLRRPNGWIMLSTPIAYINTGALIDPFKAPYVEVPDMDRQFGDALYEIGTGNNNPDQFNDFPYNDWILNSLGPDAGLGPEHADDSSQMANYPFSTDLYQYDPSNGLVSNGDIYRFKGGAPAREVEYVDGKPWRQ